MTWVDRLVGLAALVGLVLTVVMVFRGWRRRMDVRADQARQAQFRETSPSGDTDA